jgi:hypothetical protein
MSDVAETRRPRNVRRFLAFSTVRAGSNPWQTFGVTRRLQAMLDIRFPTNI